MELTIYHLKIHGTVVEDSTPPESRCFEKMMHPAETLADAVNFSRAFMAGYSHKGRIAYWWELTDADERRLHWEKIGG